MSEPEPHVFSVAVSPSGVASFSCKTHPGSGGLAMSHPDCQASLAAHLEGVLNLKPALVLSTVTVEEAPAQAVRKPRKKK